MTAIDTRSKLTEEIRRKAYKEGDFTLASGLKSDYYIDMKEVILDAEGSLLVGRMIHETIRDWNVTAVGGLELGSVPISTAVCLVFALEGKPMSNFIVRKEAKAHGAKKKIEGAVGNASRVVIVEDVVSTGGSSIKAVEAVRETGAQIVGVVAIVDREMGGREAFERLGIKFTPLFTISQLRTRK
ncbi:MAG: orotate phosphoribosyltransferase [Nitrospinae bacterium]|nr:orotate phosphoribosyltransferase [Nitrospinota bacterium]MBF0634610.1 orotate phosphoribosyltransferase [Nitrospinota bacterium]